MTGLVSVIIVNWNGKHFLNGCLTTLFKQTYKNFEVIFVDNASADDSVKYVKDNFPEVKIIQNDKNYGFAVGNRIGLEYCRGEYIFLLNNDTEVHEEVLEKLINALKPENVAGACGTIFSLSDKEKCIFTLPKIHPRTGMAVWINDDSPVRPVDYLSGNSMILKRSVIDQVGFLDETYFAYFEETDLCARIIRAGFDLLYIPDVHVWHKEMGSTPSWFNRYYMMRNQIRFVLKNFDLKYIPYAVTANFFKVIKSLKNKNKTVPTSGCSAAPSYNAKWLMVKAISWNLFFLPHTIYCRVRDSRRIGKNRRSYNENLPLRDYKSEVL